MVRESKTTERLLSIFRVVSRRWAVLHYLWGDCVSDISRVRHVVFPADHLADADNVDEWSHEFYSLQTQISKIILLGSVSVPSIVYWSDGHPFFPTTSYPSGLRVYTYFGWGMTCTIFEHFGKSTSKKTEPCLKVKSVPTQRAPDLGYAARFSSILLASADSRFEGESTLPPQAGNASR